MENKIEFKPSSYRFIVEKEALQLSSIYYTVLNGYEETKSNYYLNRQNVDGTLVTLTVSGNAVCNYLGKNYPLKAGSLSFIDCRNRHIFYPEGDGWNILYIHISGGDIYNIQREFFQTYGIVCDDFDNAFFKEKLSEIFEIQRSSTNDAFFDVSEIIYSLLIKILKHARTQSARTISLPVFNALNYIKKNFTKKICVDDVAVAANLSKFYLERLFKTETGLSIARTINNYKFEYSKILLTYNNMSVSETAYAVGCSDTQSLIKLYKKNLGITPSQYKNHTYRV